MRRHHAEAYVYIAGSMKYRVIKLGNAIWPERRVSAINSRSYGGIRDWEMLYRVKFADAGKVEFNAQGLLHRFRRGRDEIFFCNYATAKRALTEASARYQGTTAWELRSAEARYFPVDPDLNAAQQSGG